MTTIRLGVLNTAASLRHGGWLTAFLQQERPDARVELVAVAPPKERREEGGPIVPGRESAIVPALWDGIRDGRYDAVWTDLRDAPWPLPAHAAIIACFPRRNPREAILHGKGTPFTEIPTRARLSATNAVAKTQIARQRPDIVWVSLSGDLPTRLHKLHLQQADAVVESSSDLLALGFDDAAFEFVSTDIALPTPGQGAWVLCAGPDARTVAETFAGLDDAKTRLCALAEREFAAALTSAQDVPVAAWARVQRGKLQLEGCVPAPGRNELIRLSVSGPPERSGDLVAALIELFRHRGVRAAGTPPSGLSRR